MKEILTAIECLKNSEVKKVSDNIFVLPNAIVFRKIDDNATDSIRGLKYIEEVLAIKSKTGVILGNSSRLDSIENSIYDRAEINPTEIQNTMASVISMVPFSVFKEAGLDLMSCEIVDSSPEEILKEKTEILVYNELLKRNERFEKIIDRHFTGARLFKAHSKTLFSEKEKSKLEKIKHVLTYKYFLCDVDRRETEHNIINFFLAELPEKCDTIKQAYEMLKPEEVKQAELKGVSVLRQGEFFFVPADNSLTITLSNGERIREIRVGESRPNRVERGYKVNDSFFVTGTISHTGREHADLELDKNFWFKVVPNTSKANFQLTGDID